MNRPEVPARILAGVPAVNMALYHRIRFAVGDPAAWIEWSTGKSTLIVRDIELERARRSARATRVVCPAEFASEIGLSADREIATAQATAECLRRASVRSVVADRSLPLIFAHEIQRVGIAVECDEWMGILERRAKDEQEIEWLRHAQAVTEGAIEMACRMIATAEAGRNGDLRVSGEPLTSERVRSAVDVWLMERGFTNPPSIVAGGPQGGDCHDRGSGPLRTGEPIIIDVFPRDHATLYNGDCTRTVVHGDIPPEIARMHAVVLEAKAAAIAATRAGATGQTVHEASTRVIQRHGYSLGLPQADDPPTYCGMVHGTGHGVGLDVHEPPLLDCGGPELIVGDCLTIEPGLYSQALGGIRVEDMVIVTADGCLNLNRLPEGLSWA